MNFCEKCGTELEDDATVCTKCGYAIENSTKDAPQKTPSTLKNPISAIVLGGIGMLLPVCGAILGSVVNMFLSITCAILSIIGLVLAIRALKAAKGKSNTLALIALLVTILGIVISTGASVVYIITNTVIIAYFGTIVVAFIAGLISLVFSAF